MDSITLLALGVGLGIVVVALFRRSRTPTVPLPEVARQVQAGEALLIDVREPAEWASGVANGALLLPLSDLQGARRGWADVLTESNRERRFYLYWRSGARSGSAAATLRAQGFAADNIGDLSSWKRAGLPVTRP